jgi:hypothetical protein
MGNTDSTPFLSQAKSLVQLASGNPEGALRTQENFVADNTFPVLSQISSLGLTISGYPEKALDLQKQFASDLEKVVDSIPLAGHIKGGIHHALGDHEKGKEVMEAANRNSLVLAGGVSGFAIGGPVGAVAGGVGGGLFMDSINTGKFMFK